MLPVALASLGLLFAMALGVGLVPDALGQTRSSTGGMSSMGSENPLEALRQQFGGTSLDAASVPLEGAVDPELYRVGPGDTFGVTIGLTSASVLPLVVTADGSVLVPGQAPIPVAGETLATARTRIQEALQEQYQNLSVSLALVQPRRFYVHVAGAVPVPGRFPATPVTRVSDVLELTYADTTRLAVGNLARRPALRNVRIRRASGEDVTTDLARYLATGETAFNPYLQDGDVIFVPSYDPRTGAVFVDGAVAFPGAYDLRPDDTVADLIALATGDTAEPGAPIRFTRMQANGIASTQTLTFAEAQQTQVAPNDHVALVPPQPTRGSITVRGMVRYPGTYPIEQNETSVQDVIRMAGGLLNNALTHAAFIQRMPTADDAARLAPPISRTAAGMQRVQSLLQDTLGVYRNMRLGNLDFISRAYLMQELQIQNRVAMNLTDAMQPGAEPIHLQHGDHLVIPRDDRTVLVFGQVNQPGFQTWSADKPLAAYLEGAAGMSPLAGEMYAIKVGTGAYVPVEEAVIESGDLLFVDRIDGIVDTANLERLRLEQERLLIDTERLQKEDRFRRVQLFLQAFGTVASSIALILSIRSQTR